jgi:pimeloyl-ACP methyl ester carboxylesterase
MILKAVDKQLALYNSLKSLRPDFAQAALRIIYDLDMRSILPEIGSQLHFLHSLQEPTVPLWTSEYYDENLPRSTVQIINAEGQQPQLTSPDEVNGMLKVHLLRKANI